MNHTALVNSQLLLASVTRDTFPVSVFSIKLFWRDVVLDLSSCFLMSNQAVFYFSQRLVLIRTLINHVPFILASHSMTLLLLLCKSQLMQLPENLYKRSCETFFRYEKYKPDPLFPISRFLESLSRYFYSCFIKLI